MSVRLALVIANTEYTDPSLAQLTAPGKDAEDFARVLRDPGICSFDEVNVLLNEPEFVVRARVDEFFDQKKPDDLLLLYFSGHGVRDELGALYLAVKNTNRLRLRSTALKSDFIREAMDQSRSKRQVLILDCCNSGAFTQGTKGEVGGTMGVVSAFQGYGRYVLTASDATQFAWEGNQIIGETENSLFTHFLVKGLEGEADSDGDGEITVDELYDYAFEQIVSITSKQKPNKSATKQEGEIILRRITRMEDIKPISLPGELIEATEDSRTFVREGAVQQLAKLLNGRNLGLARAARKELEQIEKEDDSRTVSHAAFEALEPIRHAEKLALQQAEERLKAEKAEAERLLAEQRAEKERNAKKEARRLAASRAREERLAREKEEAERQAKAEVKLKEKQEAERIAAKKEKEERLAAEMATADRKAKEERKVRERIPRPATQKAQREAVNNEVFRNPRLALSPRNVFIYAGLFIVVAFLVILRVNTSQRANAIAMANAQATSTARVQITQAANIASTSTAIARSTNAAIAQTSTAIMRSTSTANARSTNTAIAFATVQAINNYIATLEAPAELVFGPESGSLQHDDDDFVEVSSSNVDLRDFIAEVRFLNPYSTEIGSWDYGFLFRDENGNNQFRLIIFSTGKWVLRNNIENADSTIIQSGYQLSNLNLNEGGSNTILLYCQDKKGILYINGKFVANLDLSARLNLGAVRIGTGISDGSEISGYSTDYKDFRVWEIP